MPPESLVFPGSRHDHDACRARGLERAVAICEGRGRRLTRNRLAVLELLLAEHRPMSAYELLERFDWQGRRPAPVQVYRALGFLEELGLAHRISSRNAYVACRDEEEGHGTAFLLCEECNGAAEVRGEDLERMVRTLARATGFELRGHVLEAVGRCPECVRGREGVAKGARE